MTLHVMIKPIGFRCLGLILKTNKDWYNTYRPIFLTIYLFNWISMYLAYNVEFKSTQCLFPVWHDSSNGISKWWAMKRPESLSSLCLHLIISHGKRLKTLYVAPNPFFCFWFFLPYHSPSLIFLSHPYEKSHVIHEIPKSSQAGPMVLWSDLRSRDKIGGSTWEDVGPPISGVKLPVYS